MKKIIILVLILILALNAYTAWQLHQIANEGVLGLVSNSVSESLNQIIMVIAANSIIVIATLLYAAIKR